MGVLGAFFGTVYSVLEAFEKRIINVSRRKLEWLLASDKKYSFWRLVNLVVTEQTDIKFSLICLILLF